MYTLSMDLRAIKSKQEPQSLVCYEHVLTKIHRGELVSGTLITEQGLANELGISRTPAREALRRLESDGLVVSEPRYGMKVKVLGYTEILELYEAREAIGNGCGRNLCQAKSMISRFRSWWFCSLRCLGGE